MDYTMLVNKHHKITISEINNIKKVSFKDIEIEEETLTHFLKLQKFLKEKGINIEIDSSYRSIEDQKNLITKFTSIYGKEYVKTHVAEPFYSEHHTGLCIDFIIIKDDYIPKDNYELMKLTDDYEFIHKYLSQFGFILRYPKDKEKITGYSYEPWHIRYVTKSVAKMIEEKHITLEEYYLKKHSGVLLVNKEKNMTSRDVVNIVSKTLGIKKVGHTGTLDPLAVGLLVITIGEATKIGELLVNKDKEYIAEFTLGYETDTLDTEGVITKEKKVDKNIDITKALKHFTKEYMQVVPIYSATKVNGKKLYEYARKGIAVDLPKKRVIIKKLELLDQKDNNYKIRCVVSKGTYIRSLIRDIGRYLNTYATMTSLIRTKQSNFDLKDAYSIKNIKENNFNIIPISKSLNLKKVTIKDKLLKQVQNGVKLDNFKYKDKVLFVDSNDNVVAIYNSNGTPWKVFI